MMIPSKVCDMQPHVKYFLFCALLPADSLVFGRLTFGCHTVSGMIIV